MLGGALPALVTPLREDRSVDDAGVEALVRSAVADGAAGVLVAGSTGEGTLLEPDQRALLTRRARASLGADEGALLAGASGPTLAALHADVARLADAGADVVLVLAPAIQPLRPSELVALHLEVAERAEVPTLVYHIPQLTGSSLTPDAVTELAGHPRIVGMKDSSPDAERRTAFLAAVAASDDDYVLLTGHAPTLAKALTAGAAGSITAIANVRLRQVVGLAAAVAAGDEARATELQEALSRLTAAMGAIDASVPAVLKAALQLDGVLAERWCVPPLASLPPAGLDHVRTALLA